MAFCIYGQPRTWSFCFPSLKKHLLDVYHPDVFLCTDGEQEQMEKAYHPTAMEAISPEEQLRRFKEREKIGFKRFKITADDWRNRDKWEEYELAVCDMIDRTSTEIAPWTLVEANDKNYARIKVLKTLCEAIAKVL